MGSANQSTIQKPLIEHIHELRKHLMWVAAFVALGSGAAYAIHDQLLALLQKPLGQTLYYTSPTGELTFMFKLCITVGIVFALPVILYHIFRFLEPVLENSQRIGLVKYIVWSFILAYGGLAFAYFLSLPSALKFLGTVSNGNVQALISVNEYFSFALAYVGGFAAMFQLPILILFINRVKPLKPSKMMGAQRYVILGSFILSAMLTPTPDPVNQTMMAIPVILLYQVSLILVWIINRKNNRRVKKAARLAAKHAAKHAPAPVSSQPPVRKAAPSWDIAPMPQLKPAPIQATFIEDQPAQVNKIPVTNRFMSETIPVRRTQTTRQFSQPRNIVVERRPIQPLVPARFMIGNDFC